MSTKIKELFDERFDKMEESLKEMKKENSSLKNRVEVLEKENSSLKSKLHDLELHTRASNVRVFGLTPAVDDFNFEDLSEQLYKDVFTPILEGAVRKGRIKTIPPKKRLIESAHPLMGKEGKPRPIICRLVNGFYRTVILQCQREFGVRSRRQGPGPPDSVRPPPLLHPVYEDSSAELYRFKQRLSAQTGIAAAWIAGGAVRFKLTDSDSIKRVRDIFAPIEDIISSS